jgi:antitoxin VapB
VGLNIKNEETCRLAAELARLTGDSMTGAITKALKGALAHALEAADRAEEARERRVEEAVRRVAELVEGSGGSGGLTSRDVDGLLYDERGLPG